MHPLSFTKLLTSHTVAHNSCFSHNSTTLPTQFFSFSQFFHNSFHSSFHSSTHHFTNFSSHFHSFSLSPQIVVNNSSRHSTDFSHSSPHCHLRFLIIPPTARHTLPHTVFTWISFPHSPSQSLAQPSTQFLTIPHAFPHSSHRVPHTECQASNTVPHTLPHSSPHTIPSFTHFLSQFHIVPHGLHTLPQFPHTVIHFSSPHHSTVRHIVHTFTHNFSYSFTYIFSQFLTQFHTQLLIILCSPDTGHCSSSCIFHKSFSWFLKQFPTVPHNSPYTNSSP